MESTSETKKKITLILDEDEARWLKTMVQNPMVENEDKFSSVMRNLIWVTLDNEGVKL
jgi:hypothetical protein